MTKKLVDGVLMDMTPEEEAAAQVTLPEIIAQREADVIETQRVSTFQLDVGTIDLLDRLKHATNPGQIDTWLLNNVTTLAQARSVLGTLIKLMVAQRLWRS